MPVIAGGFQYKNAGVPVNGTDEVQTLTFGGTPTGGTFKLAFGGFPTPPITWSATTATILANINTALQGLPNVGTNGIVATAGTIVAGIGTVLLTFSGANLAKREQPTITVPNNSLTGTAPTVVNQETTPGVNATALGAAPGALLIDTTNKKLYQNGGTAAAPTWALVGAQT